MPQQGLQVQQQQQQMQVPIVNAQGLPHHIIPQQPYPMPQQPQFPVPQHAGVLQQDQGLIPPPPQFANFFHNIGNTHNTLAFHASPLDSSVEDKIREKILRGKYIDLAILLHDKPAESVLVTQLADDGSPESQALLVPSHKDKEKLTFNR
jgi:hypothetical protein